MIRSSSAWSMSEIEQFLDRQRIPIRLACLSRGGGPIVCSLWFRYESGALWCATQKSAKVAGYLAENPSCGFEVAPEQPPYKGVRGQGRATLLQKRGHDVLLALIDRYLGSRDSAFARWLIERADEEVAIRIEPKWLTSWDFTERMQSGEQSDSA